MNYEYYYLYDPLIIWWLSLLVFCMKTLRMNLIYLLHEHSTRGVVYVQILVENSVAYLSDEWNSASLGRRYLNSNGLLSCMMKGRISGSRWSSRQFRLTEMASDLVPRRKRQNRISVGQILGYVTSDGTSDDLWRHQTILHGPPPPPAMGIRQLRFLYII